MSFQEKGKKMTERNLLSAPLAGRQLKEFTMPLVSIALVRESNKRLSSADRKSLVAWSAHLTKDAINQMMKRAYERLTR
ncbi:hypothetical protein SFA35_22860 [Pseudomonas sp. HR96]|uniref:hypothetical protein n=1 Tax=Pseudomonas sp. HR96 TaxID=1027966 RepID=UPI002A7483B3|nr:hypothetical protein [Pseudomonas sp. HR96]WPO99408.1 hypothetical protein SFA35_22860 [Pseudomonas sp. HR96]